MAIKNNVCQTIWPIIFCSSRTKFFFMWNAPCFIVVRYRNGDIKKQSLIRCRTALVFYCWVWTCRNNKLIALRNRINSDTQIMWIMINGKPRNDFTFEEALDLEAWKQLCLENCFNDWKSVLQVILHYIINNNSNSES